MTAVDQKALQEEIQQLRGHSDPILRADILALQTRVTELERKVQRLETLDMRSRK